MKNADQPASPVKPEVIQGNQQVYLGLTKREAFAMAAMQGNIQAFHDCDVTDYHDMAQDCVMFADCLLKALEADNA